MSDALLPEGWVFPSVSELFKVVGGGTPSTKEPQYWGDGYPWITSADIDSSGQIQMLRDVTKLGVENSTTNVVPPRTVLVVTRVGLGKVAIAAQEICFSQDVQGLLPLNEVDAEYCFHFLSHEMQRLKFDGRGTTISGITKKQLIDAAFPLPPLDEQKRIVAKTEELFVKLDKGIESLRDAQARLKLYRQSLLNSIYSGQFSVSLGLRSKKFESNDYKSLGRFVQDVSQGWSPKCSSNPKPSSESWGVIKTTAIQPGAFNGDENKELPHDLNPREHLALADGDLLITRAGPRNRVGVACMVRNCPPNLILCDKAYRVSVDAAAVQTAYLELLLNSPVCQQNIEELKSGISDSGLNLTQKRFLELSIAVPSPEDQSKIIEAADLSFDRLRSVEAEVETQLAKSEALRQSILKRAFSGKLVPQDPNDEPASALLGRIRAERAAAKPTKRQPKKRKAKAKA